MQAAPLLETVTTSLAAARGVFEVVQRWSRIDSLCEKGMRPPQLENRAAYQTISCLSCLEKIILLLLLDIISEFLMRFDVKIAAIVSPSTTCRSATRGAA